MRAVCFDTETTGFDPNTGDRIIEIGCVEIIDRKITNRSYRQLINPGRPNSQESVEITGITDEMLKNCPRFEDIYQDFLAFIQHNTLIAHNATFDMNFVNFELGLVGIPPLTNQVIDSLALAKEKFPGKRNSLDILCERFNIDKTKRDKHGALIDAELLAEVYLRLTQEEQKQFLVSELESKRLVDISEIIKTAHSKTPLEVRVFDVPQSELDAHNAFIQKHIKNSIWS